MALLKINFAAIEEFRLLPGIGAKRATLLLQLRDKYGQLDEELFSIVFGGPVPRNVLDMIDFTSYIYKMLMFHSKQRKGRSCLAMIMPLISGILRVLPQVRSSLERSPILTSLQNCSHR